MRGAIRRGWGKLMLMAIALRLLAHSMAPAGWMPQRAPWFAWPASLHALAAPADIATVTAVSGVIGSDRAPITLPIQVTSVQRLGAATVELAFDPARLRATACQRNPIFDVGLCNIAVDRNQDGTADTVSFNVISLNGVSALHDPLALVQITWAAVEAVGTEVTTTLAVTVSTFTDPDAIPIPVTAVNGQITLAAAATATATPTATVTPSATPATPARGLIYLPLLQASQRSVR